MVVAEILVGELEQGLADLQAQPDDGPADERRRPLDGLIGKRNALGLRNRDSRLASKLPAATPPIRNT